MGYITKERVAEIRAEIKAKFPELKCSITRENASGIRIAILEAPYLLSLKAYEQVHVYRKNQNDSADRDRVLSGILAIANKGVSYYETADYGNQPSHYVWLTIGEWDRPFKMVLPGSNGKPAAAFKVKPAA